MNNDGKSSPPIAPGVAGKPSHPLRNLIKSLLRWGIAAIGIYYVLTNLSWSDYVLVMNPDGTQPMKVPLARPATESDGSFIVLMPGEAGNVEKALTRNDLLVRPDRDKIKIRDASGAIKQLDLMALEVRPDSSQDTWPLVCVNPRSFVQRYRAQTDGSPAQIVSPDQVAEKYHVGLPYPLIDRGVKSRVAAADRMYLLAALGVFPLVFVITTYRWWIILRIQDIHMTLRRTFAINMVGTFWNSFLLGSTGGDVLKAIYAARNTTHGTRAVVSVLFDRGIGLLGLVLLGGSVATIVWLGPHESGDAVARQCMRVSLVSAAILLAAIVGWFIYYTPVLRRLFMIDRIISILPMNKHVTKIAESLDRFGSHPFKVLAALVMTLPVHGIVVVSAMLCGQAFGLPIEPWYYFVVVPVVVLSGSIPISPQGAGVMEFFAILLTRSQNATVTDAFTLTMSIRIVQILWNLSGGLFVIRGGYSTPTQPVDLIAQDEEPAAARAV